MGVSSTGMKSNSLSANEIIASSERLRNNKGPLSAVGVEDLSAPRRCCTGVTVYLKSACVLKLSAICDVPSATLKNEADFADVASETLAM